MSKLDYKDWWMRQIGPLTIHEWLVIMLLTLSLSFLPSCGTVSPAPSHLTIADCPKPAVVAKVTPPPQPSGYWQQTLTTLENAALPSPTVSPTP